MDAKSIKLIIGLLSMILFSCDNEMNAETTVTAQDSKIKTFNSVILKKKTYTNEYLNTTIKYDYNKDNLLVRLNFSEESYITFEYDNSARLIKKNKFRNMELYAYFIFQYESNTMTEIRYLYNSHNDSWEADNLKMVYHYDAQNNCEQVAYYYKQMNGSWGSKPSYSKKCKWLKGNLTELKHYNGESLLYTQTFQYDDKLNPEKSLNYMDEPWTKSKNNVLRSAKKNINGPEKIVSYKYVYNEYAYPIKRITVNGVESSTEIFEYDFD